MDYTNKFVQAVLKEKIGEAVAKFLCKLLCWNGSWDNYITDQDRELVKSISEEFYHVKGMHHHITSSYHQQSNELVECQIRTREDCIRKYADESQNWHKLLEGCSFLYI